MKFLVPLLAASFFLTACGGSAFSLENEPLGVWRNDIEKLDYHFGSNDNLEVIGAEGAVHDLGCTFSVSRKIPESRSIEMFFNCPQSDWPGYSELHEFIYSESGNSFVDTEYIQGIPSRRYDGNFIRITP